MTEPASDAVLYQREGRVGFVVLNRPTKLNAISDRMKAMIVQTFLHADADPDTSVIVLRGEGRSFCAGHDLDNEDDDSGGTDAWLWSQQLSESVKSEMMPFEVTKPVIGSVQGHVLGGGCQMAMFCDLIIAAENAKFGEPEIRFSNSGPAFVMPWMVGFKRAREFIYFGDTVDAQTALNFGMVNRVVKTEDLQAETLAYASRLAMIAPEALTRTKLALKRGIEIAGFRNAIQAGQDVISTLYAKETAVGAEFNRIAESEGLKAALTWRANHFKTA
ncbi:enoyl-CoA hydratase/isomerase family protein [Humitalea sp. 24SJ18S-53]|uniref:enoyl-CoA hydratase/isomerase family protein n=1 Tax=Humitalea sp. 24SJ18S-53 TaxID=3422307 RepID=UPI003D665D03